MTEQTTEQLVARWLDLEQKRQAVVEEQDVIKATLRDRLDVGKHETPAGTVTVSVNRRFDEVTARAVLPAEVITAATRPRLESSIVKKLVSPLQYEACMKDSGAPRVGIS